MRESTTLYLLSCVSRKRGRPAPAKDLYTSDWFRKARAYVERNNGRWKILSAEYGLVDPEAVIAPYERTLNNMRIADRRLWAAQVMSELQPLLAGVDRVVILAGERYREFLVEEIRSLVPEVEIPLRGLRIGKQLAWFKRELNQPATTEVGRLGDLQRFYRAMAALEAKLGGTKTLAECDGKYDWPTRGIYFFFEDSEERSESGTGPRVVRVGTHGLKAGSRSTLWKRLSQHQGVQRSGGGNHRGSIFRLLIGQADLARCGRKLPSWGIGGSPSAAAQSLSLDKEAIKSSELPVECEVSKILRAMPFLWLDVPDETGPDSLRGVIERNAIALLSNYEGDPLDGPSADWLGRSSNREKVRRSGLWNSNHVDETYDPSFLDLLEQRIDALF